MTPATRRVLGATAVLLAAPAPAQVPAAPAPTPQATPTIVPGLDDFSIPGTPAPVATATPSPAPTPLAPAARATPRPTATRVPRPSATPTPKPVPTVVPEPTPVPFPSATPIPAQPAPTAPAERSGLWWPVGAILTLIAGLLAWRTLSRREPEAPEPLRLAGEAPPAQPEPAFAPPPTPRARLTLDLRPLRAGLNLLSATVECEIAVTNAGDAPAHAVRLGVKLLSAHAGQDAELAEAYAQPVARPAAPPFVLQSGETRHVRAVAALPHAEIRAMEAAGRPIFVPLVTVNALYRAADGVEGQTAQAFAVGVERAGSPKLAPFRLDRPARAATDLAARAHAEALSL